MKIRNGFVSNSSSSSFIIQIKECRVLDDTDDTMVADEKSISILTEYGFIDTCRRSPFSEMPHDCFDEQKYMYYKVSCNEEAVMAFLFKNNIPFKASCHYGHYFVQFKKDSDSYLSARNFGLEIDMYGFSGDIYDWKQICREPKVQTKWIGHIVEKEEQEEEDED